MNKRIQKAVEAIMNLTDTYELNEVINAVKLKQNYLASEARRNFIAGDRVEFTSRNGVKYTGTVDKIKQKYILVNVDSNINGYPQRYNCLLYTSPSPRDLSTSRMPSSA